MILAILQVRMSSSRLPGKALKSILGKPMILHQIERLKNSEMIDKLVVATSSNILDDQVEQLCLKYNIEIFRGSLDNVLDRFYQCAKQYSPEHVVRLTGDCPLVDWKVVDRVIRHHLDGRATYSSNCKPPTYPDGLDVEIFTFSILEKARKYAVLPSELEHVVPYIRNNLNPSDKLNVENEIDLSRYRWTVDELDDFRFIEEVYKELYPKNVRFDMDDVLRLLDNKPYLTKINSHINRNEGTQKLYDDLKGNKENSRQVKQSGRSSDCE